MSIVKYRLKEVAADFGMAPKDIAEVVAKFSEKPKSNSQVLTDVELNAVFDYLTQKNQISSLEQVFAAKSAPKAEPVPAKAAEPAKDPVKKPQPGKDNSSRPQPQQGKRNPAPAPAAQQPAQPAAPASQSVQSAQSAQPVQPKEPERKRERRVVDTSAVQVNANRFADVDNLVSERVQNFQGGKQRIGGKKGQQQNKKDNKFRGNKSRNEEHEELQTRAPVVVVMGHVDHGKTSLLDAIRKTSVTAGEAGGITQHIGAYTVDVNGNPVTFLDTPGHAAFTSMRARGAMCTDIAVLVVAADDGIMPQTIESINHAKAANIPIIVAINKMDKPTANPDKIKEQLTKYDLIPEEWGGDTVICPISAKTGMGLEDLLEMIIVSSEVLELKANPNRRGKGTVIEARLDKTKGPIATLLVQNGTLKQGDIIIAGTAVGRVRVMTNDKGRTVKTAGPSQPVEITGLADVPAPGDEFNVVTDERMARELVEQRRQAEKDAKAKLTQKVTLDNLFARMQEGEMKELPLIVKADVQGSAEAVKASLEKISNEEVRVRVIHAGVGAINESDILLASTAGAIIVGFNVRPDAAAQANGQRANVDMRFYRVIYDAIDEIEAAMKGMLAPKFEEAVIGHAEVRMTYKVSAIGTIAGCMVKDGKVSRDAKVRVLRDNIVIHEGEVGSLQRFKDAVKEVTAGYECGMSVVKFNDIKEGDIFECFVMQEVKR